MNGAVSTLFDSIPGLMSGEDVPVPPPKEAPIEEAPAKKILYDRDYQTDCVARVFDELETSNSTLVVMATGLGKTVISTRVAEQVLAGKYPNKGFLFLAHRDELIGQAYRTFRDAFPGKSVEIEKAEDRASSRADIVIASVQTLSKPKRLDSYSRNRFGVGCVDEAHHCVASNATYNSIMKYFDCRWLGLTATPDRSDEIALGQMFGSVAFQFDIVDGINEGWLVPVGQRIERCDDIDYSEVALDKDGEFNADDLNRVMRRDKALYGLAEAAIKYSNFGDVRKRSTLIFCASVEHAQDVADILNARNLKHGTGRAACIHYKSKDRREIIEEYKRRNIRFLTNVGILGEGFDDDRTTVIINGRPIRKSRSLFAQFVGRATRPLYEIQGALSAAKSAEERRAIIKASDKPGAMVVDMVGLNHKLILTMTDILGGRYTDEATRYVRDKVAASSKVVDVEAELKKAERELAKIAERERAVRLRTQVDIKVDLAGKNINPFDVMDVVSGRESGLFVGKSATVNQVKLLRKMGLPAKELENLSMHKAGLLIQSCTQRRRMGLCSYRQAAILRRFGYDCNIPTDAASKIIDGIKANGWRRVEL